ncbi:carboxymuconolactone decarboxylase family protein [Streptomyces sp. Je 1-332]|uniref:carboxymuconolactone decarboxylase family protein n=1 Tax=Streptomyces sp. Je 1-332 TaxID=3231270 RepID=UPI003459E82F
MSAPDGAGVAETPQQRATRGWAAMAEVMQCPAPPAMSPASLGGLSAQHIFGDLWDRPGLSRRDRRLITLTALAVLGQDRLHTPLHIRAALASSDLTEAELREMAVQIAYYAGWPLATSFDAAVDTATGHDTGYEQVTALANTPTNSAAPPPDRKEQP